MGNIRKINGHDIKDGIAKNLAENIKKDIISINDNIDLVEDEVNQGKADMEVIVAEVEANLEDIINNRSYVNIRDFGAVGDGVTDDTQAFMNAFTSSGDMVIIKMPIGIYMINTGNYTLPDKKIILEGAGEGTVIKGTFDSALNIINDFEMKNLKINTLKGIYVEDTSNEINIRIRDCVFDNVTTVLRCNYDTNIIKSVIIENNIVTDAKSVTRLGCYVSNMYVCNNICSDFSETVFQVGLDNEVAGETYCGRFVGKDNVISDLHAKDTYRGFMIYANNVFLENNTIKNIYFNPPAYNGSTEDTFTRSAIYVRSSALNVVIRNNIFEDISGWNVQIKDCNGIIRVEGNNISNPGNVSRCALFHFASYEELYCLHNTASGINTNTGIYCSGSNSEIIGNRITDSSVGYAIRFYGSIAPGSRSVVKNNHLEVSLPSDGADYYNAAGIGFRCGEDAILDVSDNYICNTGSVSGTVYAGVRCAYPNMTTYPKPPVSFSIERNIIQGCAKGIYFTGTAGSVNVPMIFRCVSNTGIDISGDFINTPPGTSKAHLLDDNNSISSKV